MQDTAFLFDYYIMWSFGALALQGANPYDEASIRATLAGLDLVCNHPLCGHVPWILWLYSLLALFPFDVSRILFFAIMLSAIAVSIGWSWRFLKEEHANFNLTGIELAIAVLAFSPNINSLRWGQTNPLLLLGLIGFLHYRRKGDERSAGLALSFLLSKPHLVLPLLAYLTAYWIRTRRASAFVYCALALLLQLGMTFALSPQALHSYPQDMLRCMEISKAFHMPAFSILLPNLFGIPALYYLILFIGISAGAVLGLKRNSEVTKDIYLVLPLSLLVAPYTWSHSYVLLLIPYLDIVWHGLRWWKSLTLAILGIAALVQYWLSFTQAFGVDVYMVFIPITILTLQCLIRWSAYPLRAGTCKDRDP
ncbi:MAG: DUF2029 domain-containing protein [SAR324 cluster bacterium]|uniref:DUF2029 domain-containing protein n=1 Tax=SAR324 cluster bacterium TaxID=2024889 RepID=A0A7X9IKP6_9DELT|nr:DUF2029 domain-containing protein [SAR324 cluster bacterium]